MVIKITTDVQLCRTVQENFSIQFYIINCKKDIQKAHIYLQLRLGFENTIELLIISLYYAVK